MNALKPARRADFLRRSCVFVVLFLLLKPPHALRAQTFEHIVEGIPLERNGQIYTLPFAGGLDSFLPQFVDIDADGDFDLLLSQPDERGPRLSLFENLGTPQNHLFRLNASAYDTMMVGSWFQFVDIDGDNDYDLYHADGRNGLSFRRNNGSPTHARFAAATDSVLEVNGQKVVCEYSSIPAFADLDADGDYDFFYGASVQGNIVLYRNLGDSNTPAFLFETALWQNIIIISGGRNDIRPGQGPLLHATEPLHGANGLAFTDLDHDGDQDFFYGDLFHKSVYYLRNNGTPQNPNVAISDSLFPQPQPVNTLGHNIPRFADIDGDGDDDFFVTCLRQVQNNFLFYRNVGEATRPQFKSATQNFLPMLDAGGYSVPTFGDLDGDGDEDMLLGNLDGQFVYYENDGAPNAPAFRWVTDNFQNLRSTGYAVASPVLVDIDADGDWDIFSGDFYGRLAFFENRGTANNASFVLNTGNFASIDVGNFSAPFFADGDRDGDLDLYVGEGNAGTINIFENFGSALQPNFTTLPQKEFRHAVPVDDGIPCLLDFDGDGYLDLFVGHRAGKILHYRGTAALDSFMFVSSAFEGIDVGLQSAPRFVDWDDDGRLDLIIGEQAGGLNYYRAPLGNRVAAPGAVPEAFTLEAYPNPFAVGLNIILRVNEQRITRAPLVRIYNLLGAIVAELPLHEAGNGAWRAQWLPNARQLTSGIYFARVRVGEIQITRKAFYLH